MTSLLHTTRTYALIFGYPATSTGFKSRLLHRPIQASSLKRRIQSLFTHGILLEYSSRTYLSAMGTPDCQHKFLWISHCVSSLSVYWCMSGRTECQLFFSDSAAAMRAEVRKNSSHMILGYSDWHTMVSSSNMSHADEVREHKLLHCGV